MLFQPAPFKSKLAEPMRRAIKGYSGVMTGLDYDGIAVMATYQHVKVLNFGIRKKMVTIFGCHLFVKTCIMLGHELKMQVVEDETALLILKKMGCDIAQGYHIARPMPAEDLMHNRTTIHIDRLPGHKITGGREKI